MPNAGRALSILVLWPDGQIFRTGRIFCRWTTRDSFKTAWFREFGQAGIQGLTFHDLKHTFLTHLHNLGVIYEVRQWLGGHTMPGVTASYSHGGIGWDHQLREAVSRLDVVSGLVSGNVEGKAAHPVTLKGKGKSVPRHRIELWTPAFSGQGLIEQKQRLSEKFRGRERQ